MAKILKAAAAIIGATSISISAWAATPPTSGPPSEGVRSRLAAIDRTVPDAPRRLTAPGMACGNPMPGIKVATTPSKIAPRAPMTASRILQKVAPAAGLRGTVLASTAWGVNPVYGVYQVPTAEGEAFTLIGPSEVPLTEGYDDGNGTYYSAYIVSDNYGWAQDCHLAAFNTSDWSLIYDEVMPDFSLYSFGSAEDPTTGEVYACCSNATFNGYDWVKIDYPTKSVTVVKKELPIYFAAVGCDDSGQFYGITEFGRFVKIDKNSGEYTEYPSDPIIPSSVNSSSQHGGCVDNANRQFLLATYDQYGLSSSLHSFNLDNGEYSKIVDFPNGEQVLGLYIPAAEINPLAPGTPGLTVTCENGSMDAVVTIAMPATFHGGADATGTDFNFTLSADGVSILTGTGAAGSQLVKTVQIDNSGLLHFSVVLSNQHGESRMARYSCYIGKGTPSAPANVVLSWNDNTALLSWDAVTTTSDGGYIDPAGVTYNVATPEGEIVASGLTSTSATFPLTAPASGIEKTSYKVAAVYDTKMSGYTASNQITLGSYQVPMNMAFNEVTFPEHTVIDANEDGKSWILNFGKAMMTYNFTMQMDDWLISPPVALAANSTYPFKARVQAYDSSCPERIEVKAGRGTTVEAMTIDVVGPTVVTDESYEGAEITGQIVTDEAGNYHIGFHGISDAYMYNLYILSYEIEARLSGEIPTAVSDLSVVPDETGALKAQVSFTVPSTNVSGAPVGGKLEVVVTRDGETEIYHEDAEPGTPVSLTDIVETAGEYTYTVTCAYGDDISRGVSATAYIGPKPAALTASVSAYQSAPDKVNLSWKAVTTDIDGNPVQASDITYDVYSVGVNSNGQLVLGDKITTSPLSATSYEASVTPSSVQDYIYFAVKSYHRGVGATDLTVGSAIFGDAYSTPHRISGKNEIERYFFEGWTSDAYAKINLGSSANGVASQDDDDSYILINTPYLDQSAYIATGRVSLSGLTSPTLIFWIYGFDSEAADTNVTSISVICDGKEEVVRQIPHNYLTPNRWNRMSSDLSEYAGKDVRVKIALQCNGIQYTLYDNIYIGENFENDLAVSLAAPAKVSSGTPFSLNATVKNLGAIDVQAFDVNLLRDGEIVATRNITATLPAEESTTVMFEQTLGVQDAVNSVYTSEVVYAGDEIPDNNISSPITVSRTVNDGPVVTNLYGTSTSDGNLLTWDAVETEKSIPVEMTEGFEDAESWAHEAEGWLFIDADDSPVGGFSSFEIPGITPKVTKASFFVWDASQLQPDSRFAPRSGDKFIASLYRADYQDSDEWAVSPLLHSDAQTISFFAKSYSGSYSERIQILYTSGDADDLESYVAVPNVGGTVPDEWTEYTFSVPEGTRHFAVRSTAAGAYMLELDDFTFIRDKGFFGELLGYNVYCDRIRLNDTPLTQPTFTHANPAPSHTYHVTAVYDNGESELSQPLLISTSSVDGVSSTDLTIALEGRMLTVAGTAGEAVTLFSLDGRTIFRANGDCRTELTPGSYLLSVGTTVRKLIVR
ncbi:MAG: choice-of-anchor J domain-containing protein [Muribaculaceae bacterium]|nr:choice-of-anchor J domain-containing protein [Muribaculaceae bacterium]